MFQSLKSTKIKVLILLSISVSLFIVLLISNIFITDKRIIHEEEQKTKTQVVKAYEHILDEYYSFYQSRLNGILKVPGVKDAIKAGDREKLYKLVLPKWKILKNENSDVSVIHFVQADGVSLLRVHKPKMYGDNIAQKRAMCAHIIKYQKPIFGFEAGYRLQGYRVMIPIFEGKRYLGAVEIGVNPNFVLNKINKLYNVTGVVFAKKSKIYHEELASKTDLLIGEYLLDSNSLDKKELVYHLSKDYKFQSDQRIGVDDKIYDVYMINHKDFKGDVSAKTLIFNDMTKINEEFISAIINIIIYSIVFFILLLFVVKIGFEKLLDKVDSTNEKLEKNVAFLKSHQLAMDESSIVSKADLKGNITYVNDNFCKVTGYTKEEVMGKPHNIVRHMDNSSEVFTQMWNTIKAKKVWKGVLLNSGKKEDYWVDIVILPILDDKDNIVEYIAVRHDITKRIQQQQKLDNAANTDTITGLGSRYKLNQDIKMSTAPALAIFNIDSFSQINDFYGHEKGDDVIYMLGVVLSDLLNEENYSLYHLQGDEFVILNKETQKESFVEKVTQVVANIQTIPIALDNEEIFLTLSTSISFEKKEKLLTTADMALKIAKKENKHLVVYDDFLSLNEQYENNMKWTKKIKEAIDTDNIVPVFQPIVNNSNEVYEKYEALVRLKDGEDLISPYFFLEISKKTKYYGQITKIMIQKTFENFYDRTEEFSLNLTIEDILDEDIQTFILLMLRKYEIGSRVVFEIVESESIENFAKIQEFITNIKSFNCKIGIDDFGTGYSNFEYLLKLKADYIKIDGSMIKDIDTNQETEMVVSTIIEFAKKMDMKTIAEFVENESILKKVKELGIDYSQGYHFSKPLTEKELT